MKLSFIRHLEYYTSWKYTSWKMKLKRVNKMVSYFQSVVVSSKYKYFPNTDTNTVTLLENQIQNIVSNRGILKRSSLVRTPDDRTIPEK